MLLLKTYKNRQRHVEYIQIYLFFKIKWKFKKKVKQVCNRITLPKEKKGTKNKKQKKNECPPSHNDQNEKPGILRLNLDNGFVRVKSFQYQQVKKYFSRNYRPVPSGIMLQVLIFFLKKMIHLLTNKYHFHINCYRLVISTEKLFTPIQYHNKHLHKNENVLKEYCKDESKLLSVNLT